MYEFAFFDARLRDRFLHLLRSHAVTAVPGDADEPLTVGVDEDIDDATLDLLEQEYDRLLDEQAELTEAGEPDAVSRVGVQFSRADGSVGVVRLDPALARRLLASCNYAELQALVQQIVDASRDPVRPLCKP